MEGDPGNGPRVGPQRCLEHGLVAGPDGRCVVCRRARAGVEALGADRVSVEPSELAVAPEAAAGWRLPRWAPLAGGAAAVVLLVVGIAIYGVAGSSDVPAAPAAPVASLQPSAPSETVGQASKRVRVRMYGASWCPACASARGWLQQQNVRYAECDVERSEICSRELRRHNPRGTIPTFLVGDQVLVGFSAQRLPAAILGAAGAAR